jgi:hypothetical protein
MNLKRMTSLMLATALALSSIQLSAATVFAAEASVYPLEENEGAWTAETFGAIGNGITSGPALDVETSGDPRLGIHLDVQGSPDWQGFILSLNEPISWDPSWNAVTFDLTYKFRAGHEDQWLVSTPWGSWPMDRNMMFFMAYFAGQSIVEYALANGIDLSAPDIPAVAGYGAQFYASAEDAGEILDAYWLGDSVDLGREGDLEFYGTKHVQLNIAPGTSPSSLELKFYLTQNFGYEGDIWISGLKFETVDSWLVPTEFLSEKVTEHTSVSLSEHEPYEMVDDDAIQSTVDLYAYLQGVAAGDYLLYGHQNFNFNKNGASYPGSENLSDSDVKDVIGDYPAVLGIDTLSLIGMETAWQGRVSLHSQDLSDPANIADYIEGTALTSIEAAKNGAIITLSAHMSDPGQVYDHYINGNVNAATGKPIYTEGDEYPWNFYGYGYDNSTRTPVDPADGLERSPYNPMRRILPGLDANAAFTAYLDIIADYCLKLQEEGVTVLFRPFHENTGNWFWWGPSGCSSEEFAAAWQYMVTYMRDERDVHNLLYVFSPNGSFPKTESGGYDYGETYPGDDWVDITAFDDYTTDPNTLMSDVRTVSDFAKEHGKVAASSEVGGGMYDLFLQTFLADGINMAYLLQWWNGSYTPYLTTPTRSSNTGNEFIRFANDPRTVFASGTNIKLTRPEDEVVPEPSPAPSPEPSPAPSYYYPSGSYTYSEAPSKVSVSETSRLAESAGGNPVVVRIPASYVGASFRGSDLISSKEYVAEVIADGGFSITLPSATITDWGITSASTVDVLISANKDSFAPALLDKLKAIDAANEELSKAAKSVNITLNGATAAKTLHPYRVAADVSKLTDSQKAKLTGVVYDIASSSYRQLGGELSADRTQFIFYSYESSGKIGVIISDNLTALKLKVNQKEYSLNNRSSINDVAPYISADNRTNVPIRLIAEALGCEVSWNDLTKTVTMAKGAATLHLTINQPIGNGLGVPVIVGDRTFVPLRYVSEALGANVVWHDATQEISIYQ